MADSIPHAFSAIHTGSGLLSGMFNSLADKYKVICCIEVENLTNISLTHPVVRLAGGQLEIPPRFVLPGKREAMVARKNDNTATGSYGTVSWLIEGRDRRIVVMWSAPFNFDFYNNWLAVGITGNGVKEHAPGEAWYQEMYEGTSSALLRFDRKKYDRDAEIVVHEEDGIEVSGIMSTGHQAQVVITVRPVNN